MSKKLISAAFIMSMLTGAVMANYTQAEFRQSGFGSVSFSSQEIAEPAGKNAADAFDLSVFENTGMSDSILMAKATPFKKVATEEDFANHKNAFLLKSKPQVSEPEKSGFVANLKQVAQKVISFFSRLVWIA
ncbi:hypothetical protein ID47_02105 [Candidatus Paracaedibacter acanthamoebae]|uniref:Uncharacterized protein n=2 Tax=Candidatus Odyssella acanthamoebae TaxID=91604 RepID=A0A077AYI5_9PROT|nr:hypothetical protein ID47_02105 [Candidatus Paracaedibacter acanthamoebae]